MDLVLRNGWVIDGTGQPRFAGDVGIQDGRITEVGTVTGRGREEIDVAGAIVAPGFIDVHTHYDAQAFWDPMLSPSVFHGVTSAIAGNCGFTLAPLSGRPDDTDYLLRMLSRVEGMPLATLRAALKPDWKSFGEYLDRLNGTLAINVAFMVGHSALRRAVMGERAVGQKATEQEIEAMCALLAQSLSEGGVGLSTSVSFTHSDYEGQPVPSRAASREELMRLAAVLQRYPGTWLELVLGKMQFTDEEYTLMTGLSRAAERSLNWNLVMVNSTKQAELASQLHASDYATARGATVLGLVPAVSPKIIVNFITGFTLDAIPGWMELIVLPHDKKREALRTTEMRNRLRHVSPDTPFVSSFFADWGAQVIEVVNLPHNRQWIGRTIAEYASACGKENFDALCDLAVEEDLKFGFSPPPGALDDHSWRLRAEAWQDDRCIIGGSDAGAHLDMINTFAFSTQLLGEGVRLRGLLPLERAVHLITARPAEAFGLVGRGRIAPGMAADIVVFSESQIGCGPMAMRADLPGGESRLYAEAEGVRSVIVNGIPVVHEGKATGRIGGRILRSGQDTQTVPVN